MSDTFNSKSEKEVSDFIFENFNKNNPIEIIGQASKKIGRAIQTSQSLSLNDMSGILEYFPEELYIKVLPGTSLQEIETTLKNKNQYLGLNQMILVIFILVNLTLVLLVALYLAICQDHLDLKMEL